MLAAGKTAMSCSKGKNGLLISKFIFIPTKFLMSVIQGAKW